MNLLAWNQPHKVLPGLPSWVPDLSSPISDGYGEHRHYKLFSAGGPQSHQPLPTTFRPFSLPSSDLAPISLACYPIDIVDTVGSPWHSDNVYNAENNRLP
jgi:hypothetical protein